MSPADKGQAEPSMEEILASIRRIISDDQEEEPKAEDSTPESPKSDPVAPQPAAAVSPKPQEVAPASKPDEPAAVVAEEVIVADAPPVEGAEEMVLEEIIEEPALDATEAPPAESLAEEGRDAFLAEQPESISTPADTVVETLPVPSDRDLDNSSVKLHAEDDYTGLVSPPVREKSTLTFAELAGAIHARGFSLGNVGMTLEDLIRDLLRPHLKDWLDRNLPGIVERMVRAEIERMVREAEERKDLL